MYDADVKRINALKKALLALEQVERVKEITEHWESWYELEESGTGLEDLVDDLKDILKNKKVFRGKTKWLRKRWILLEVKE